MRIFADMHISPLTVQHLTERGHDVVRSNSVLPDNAPDDEIAMRAMTDNRAVLTQDLGFSTMIALSGAIRPSIITLRLSDSRVENVIASWKLRFPRWKNRSGQMQSGQSVTTAFASASCPSAS